MNVLSLMEMMKRLRVLFYALATFEVILLGGYHVWHRLLLR
ncbi:MAG TPA: hypothetical protein VLT16_08815 [Candidatus Limnocylindrales bacterium]|nr:hypothetical protein [Candidatus Limnocylindrales bacterium]